MNSDHSNCFPNFRDKAEACVKTVRKVKTRMNAIADRAGAEVRQIVNSPTCGDYEQPFQKRLVQSE
jgi:hypothetical protein